MKKVTIICSVAALLFAMAGCEKPDGIDQDLSFLNTAGSANINKMFNISTDNSGNVTIFISGEGISSSTINFGHGTGAAGSATVSPGGTATHAYPEGSYTVTVVSTDVAGKATTNTYPLTVTYRAPENVAVTIDKNANGVAVKATALYAGSYMVYFGDVANEVGTTLAPDATVYHAYAVEGTYNIKVVAIGGNALYLGAAKTELVTPTTIGPFSFKLPITFEEPGVNYFFGTFGDGQQFATVANPKPDALNASSLVGKFTRGSQSWSGTYSPMNYFIDLSVTKKLKVLAYNPDPALIGKKLNVELESAYGGSPSNGVAVLKVPFTTSGAWEELVFDFGTVPGIPADAKFGQLVLRFNDALDGNGTGGGGSVIYVDNFRLTN